MEVRKLVLFVPDDRPVKSFLKNLYDVNATPYDWKQHCTDAFLRKRLTIDLMSADVNFSLDETDPEDCPSGSWNSWGLAHAIAALAERRPMDSHGNLLPFAWEIRSAAPALVRNDPSAIRLYGLLRALAAKPRDAETFEECIKREHQERWRQPLVEDESLKAKSDLVRILIQDFACQKTQDSLQSEMIERLLPQWRLQLMTAVRSCDVLLHLPTMQEQVRALTSTRFIDAKGDAPYCIPFQDSAGRPAYGINLFSVFGDLIDKNAYARGEDLVLDVTQPFDQLTVDDKSYPGPRSIMEWVDYLLSLVTGLQTKFVPQRVASMGERLEEHVKADTVQSLLDELAGQYSEICILYCIIVARRLAGGKPYTTQGDLFLPYKIDWNENTFSRPLKRQRHMIPDVGGPDRFAKHLCEALQKREHGLGEHWDNWIRPGLVMWMNKFKDRYNLPIAKKFVPALFPDGAP